MDAPLHDTPHDDKIEASLRLGTWVLGTVVALATAAALGSHLFLSKTEAAPALVEAAPATPGAAPQFDHSVVSTQDLGEALHPGASIAQYTAP